MISLYATEISEKSMLLVERFVLLMHDRTSESVQVNYFKITTLYSEI